MNLDPHRLAAELESLVGFSTRCLCGWSSAPMATAATARARHHQHADAPSLGSGSLVAPAVPVSRAS